MIHAQYKRHLHIETSPFADPRKCLIQFPARDKHQILNGISFLDIVDGMEYANKLLQ